MIASRSNAARTAAARIRRGIAIVALLGILPVLGPSPATAGPPIDATVAGTDCSEEVDWRAGQLYQILGRVQFFTGTARLCLFSLRYASLDGYSYVGGWSSLDVEGSTTSADGAASLTIRSSLPAIGGVYGATGDASGRGCSTAVSVGIQLGPFSLSGQPRICSGGSIVRRRLDTIVAAWTTGEIGLTRRWEEEYFQKLPGGSHPTISARARLPRYVEIATAVVGQPGVYTYSVRPAWTSVRLSL